MAAAVPKEIRAARSFLRQRNINTKEIAPRKFAAAAKELNKGFRELLKDIAQMRYGGQGQSAQRRSNIRRESEN